MSSELLKYWPIVSSFVGMLIGGAITWATAKTKLEQLFNDMKSLEARLSKHEEMLRAEGETRNVRHIEVISRLSSIEATLTYLKTMLPIASNK